MTVTETKSGSMFDGMDVKTLVALAADKYGLNIDPTVHVDAIKAELVRQEEARSGAAKTLNEKSAMLVVTKDDPLVPVLFNRYDFAYADLQFTYDSGRGYINRRGTKEEIKRGRERGQLEGMPSYHLFPGNEYKLPMSVVRHLQSLIYTESQPVIDPVTGMISGNRPVKKPRFSLNIVMTDEQLKGIGKTSL